MRREKKSPTHHNLNVNRIEMFRIETCSQKCNIEVSIENKKIHILFESKIEM